MKEKTSPWSVGVASQRKAYLQDVIVTTTAWEKGKSIVFILLCTHRDGEIAYIILTRGSLLSAALFASARPMQILSVYKT